MTSPVKARKPFPSLQGVARYRNVGTNCSGGVPDLATFVEQKTVNSFLLNVYRREPFRNGLLDRRLKTV